MLSRVARTAAARTALRALSTAPVLPGLMQRGDLLISKILRFAADAHGDVEVVSRAVEGVIHRCA